MKRILVFAFILFTSLCAGAYISVPASHAHPLSFGMFSIDAPEVLGSEVAVRPVYSTIRFVGDVMLGRDVESKMQSYGISYPFSMMPINPADSYLVGNFEAAIPFMHVHTADLSFSLSVDPANISSLRAYGFTHLGLSNNHTYDFGADDYLHTVEVLKEASTTPFGDPKHVASSSIPVLLVGTSTRVALVPIFAVGETPTAEVIAHLMERAKQISDIQIVFIHWGEEYHLTHSALQQQLAYELIDDGADAIVGHHPHVVEDVELYHNKPIFYSLGNFIFDQYFSDNVMNGLMLQMTPDHGKLTFDLLPVSTIGSETAPHMMPQSEKDKFLAVLAQKSSAQLSKMIRQGVIVVQQN